MANQHRNRHVAVTATALLAVAALAACGDDSSSEASDASSDTSNGTTAGSEAADDTGGEPAADDGTEPDGEPARLTFLWELPGESADAIADFDNGAQIAVDEINESGGVLGQPLEIDRLPIAVTDPQAARATFLEAVEGEPSGIIGIPFGAPGYARDLTAVEIPMIMAATEPQLANGAEAGSEYIYIQEPSSANSAANAVQFAVDELGAESVAILATDDNYGRSNSDDAKVAIDEHGLDLVSEQYVPTTTTDVTSQLLALEDPDALLMFQFPNVQALTLRQLNENGIDVPVLATASQLVVYNGLVEPTDIGTLYDIEPCSPTPDSSRQPAAEFATRYEEEFGGLPSAKASLTHDSVHLMAMAIEAAGSATDHEAINAELQALSWDGGACQPEYQSDGAHFLSHQQVLATYDADGGAEEVATFALDPQDPVDD